MKGVFDDPFFSEDPRMDGRDMFDHFDRHFNDMFNHMNKMMESAFKGFGSFDDPFLSIGHDPQRRYNEDLKETRNRYETKDQRYSSDKHSQSGSRGHPPLSETGKYIVDDENERFTRPSRLHSQNRNYTQSKSSEREAPSQKRNIGKPIIEEPDDNSYHFDTKSQRRSNYDGYQSKLPQGTHYYSSVVTTFNGPDGLTQQVRRKAHDSETGETRFQEMRRIGDQAIVRDRKIDRDGKAVDNETRHNVNDGDIDRFNSNWEQRRSQIPFSRRPNAISNDKNALGYSKN